VDANVTGDPGDARLAVVLAATGGAGARTVVVGPLVAGSHRYRRDLAGCDGGCRLSGVAVTRPGVGGAGMSVVVRLDAIATRSGVLAAGFDKPGRWRVNGPRSAGATVTVQAGPALAVTAAATGPGDAFVEYVDTPDAVPVILAGPTPADDPAAGDFTFPGLGDNPQSFVVIDREAVLPRVGRRAVLFDLDQAVRAAERSSPLSDNSRLRYEVWAAGSAPADLAERLAAAGVVVLSQTSLVAEQERLGRAAPALGLRLYLLAGLAAMVLALVAVVLGTVVGGRSRWDEWAGLRVAGVPAGALRRALVREYLHLLGVPLGVGVAVGVGAAALMLPGVALVAVGSTSPDAGLALGPGALVDAIVATGAGLAGVVAAMLVLVRRATPDRLRQGVAG
jgi:putative ABC transport system permease protein